MKETWIAFYLNGKELSRYTVRGTFEGELEDTKELLAYENNCDVSEIKTRIISA